MVRSAKSNGLRANAITVLRLSSCETGRGRVVEVVVVELFKECRSQVKDKEWTQVEGGWSFNWACKLAQGLLDEAVVVVVVVVVDGVLRVEMGEMQPAA